LFSGRARLDRKGVDSSTGNVAKRSIDHPLALESIDPGKAHTLDLHGEVAFPAAVVAMVAAVLGAVVDDGKVGGLELRLEELFDFSGKWS